MLQSSSQCTFSWHKGVTYTCTRCSALSWSRRRSWKIHGRPSSVAAVFLFSFFSRIHQELPFANIRSLSKWNYAAACFHSEQRPTTLTYSLRAYLQHWQDTQTALEVNLTDCLIFTGGFSFCATAWDGWQAASLLPNPPLFISPPTASVCVAPLLCCGPFLPLSPFSETASCLRPAHPALQHWDCSDPDPEGSDAIRQWVKTSSSLSSNSNFCCNNFRQLLGLEQLLSSHFWKCLWKYTNTNWFKRSMDSFVIRLGLLTLAEVRPWKAGLCFFSTDCKTKGWEKKGGVLCERDAPQFDQHRTRGKSQQTVPRPGCSALS